MSLRAMFRPGMRAYVVPLIAGTALTASAFLPWVVIGGAPMRGVPDVASLWIAGLGAMAAVLATLSLITRKNSRHPLLLIGLISLGIMFLSWRIMPQAITNRALIRSQAIAIVDKAAVGDVPSVAVGSGIYVGLAAAGALVGFGLTIVVKRASRPYLAVDPNDDVE
jgi:hypothetical protein